MMNAILASTLFLSLQSPALEAFDQALLSKQGARVHMVTALADNEHQGIVKVKSSLGNGDDARNNLYWGALYGQKTFLKKKGFKLVHTKKNPTPLILERLVFEKRKGKRLMTIVADAYRGKEIKRATEDFLNFTNQKASVEVEFNNRRVIVGGDADLVVYVGHNGLMDFALDDNEHLAKRTSPQLAAVFACISNDYFRDKIISRGAVPLVMTKTLLAPEGYVTAGMFDALLGRTNPVEGAAFGYAKYQKISKRHALKMFTN